MQFGFSLSDAKIRKAFRSLRSLRRRADAGYL
jgi:hypothetical protein